MSIDKRKFIPEEVITAVLVSSARRCCLCYGLNGDFGEKQGQVAHVDHDPSNAGVDNLAFLCLNHHDQYDGMTRQSKGFTVDELIAYRKSLYQEVERRRNALCGIDKASTGMDLHFDAGSRIQAVRKELGIKISQFVEMLNFSSQREYESIEERSAESPLYLLEQIQGLTGASLEYLKHGIEPRYDFGVMPIYPLDRVVSFLRNIHPENFYLTLETKELHVGIIVKLSEYHFEAYDFGMTLDYWNWVDEFWAFSNFHKILLFLDGIAFQPFGAIIPTQCDKQLYTGKIHPLTALNKSSIRKSAWTNALVDYKRESESKQFYDTRYGNWVIKVQDALKEHLELMDRLEKESEK